MPGIDEAQVMWLEDDGEDEDQAEEQMAVQAAQLAAAGVGETEQSAAVAALEDELQRTRKELMDVRKELAAKTVQLSRKEVAVAQERVAELAANVAIEKDKQLSSLATHVEHLQTVLGQKEEELEESRRLYNAQKRALREALAVAVEAEAVERQADEARARTAVALAVEEDLERLQHELALLQARHNLEMRARDAELQSLRSELQAANANRKQAVASAEAALTEAWQAEVVRATEEAEARVVQLEAEVARVRQQMEENARNADTVTLAGELASLNQQKVAIQREFDAFKDITAATARQNREMTAKLMEEIATLKSRLAARAFQDVQAGFTPQSKIFSSLTPPGGAGAGVGGGDSAFSTGVLSSGAAWVEQFPALLARLERQRKGLVPALVIGSVLVLFLLVAVVRAAAVTRNEHSGGLCFLAHLGINVGPGCGPSIKTLDSHHHHHTVAEVAREELEHLMDETPRVHDVEAVAEAVAVAEAEAVASAATVHKALEVQGAALVAVAEAGSGSAAAGVQGAALVAVAEAGSGSAAAGVPYTTAAGEAVAAMAAAGVNVKGTTVGGVGHQAATAEATAAAAGASVGDLTAQDTAAAAVTLGIEAAAGSGALAATSTTEAATTEPRTASMTAATTEYKGDTAVWIQGQQRSRRRGVMAVTGRRAGLGSAQDTTAGGGDSKVVTVIDDEGTKVGVAVRKAARTARRQSLRTLGSGRAAR